MRTFACGSCDQLVLFENTKCLHCGAALGFRWFDRELVTLPDELSEPVRCANELVAACNALVEEPGELCASCALTRTRPADGDADGLAALAVAEAAKRRLLFELGELGVRLPSWREREGGLAFDLLSSADAPVITGHADGVITLDLAEADPAHREQVRRQLEEPYRTLLGHFRHEVGHFCFEVLAPEGSAALERCRAVFGDDREDYQVAIDRHYADGPPSDWPQRYISAYATMHPYEDWAETWAHYLHIRDTAQTAVAYGVRVAGPSPPRQESDDAPELGFVPVAHRQGIRELLVDWLPLTYALNALNRSMGAGDLYPFVLTEPVVEKLELIDELVLAASRSRA